LVFYLFVLVKARLPSDNFLLVMGRFPGYLGKVGDGGNRPQRRHALSKV
jgi:hypothetical protein